MAFGTITSTSNTFGSVDGTATGSVPGTLSGSIGVPGPQGPAGSQGPQGQAGEGVPAGGTAGQFLTKIDETNYNTDWTTLDVSDKRDLTDYDFTNVADTYLTTFGLTLEPAAGSTTTYDSSLDPLQLKMSYDNSNGGTEPGEQREAYLSVAEFKAKYRTWTDNDGIIEPSSLGTGFNLTDDALLFTNWDGTRANESIRYGKSNISFGNGSTQSIAFPGFNNAALTGNPTAPTATFGDNDTSIATTAFVQAGLLGGTANARNLEVYVRNQSGASIPAGSIVYISGATGNRPLITLSQANNDANSAQTMGFTKTTIANNAFGYVIVRGEVENLDTSALTEGDQLYLSPTVAGAYTTTKPVAPQHMVYVGIVIRSHPTLGAILVAVQNGYELAEVHDVLLTTPANNDLLAYELSTDLWKNKSAATLGLAGLNSPTFTGTPFLPTGTTGVTQTAGNNTTALATTAFVTAAVPAFATNVQTLTSTSTTTALSPFNSRFSQLAPFVYAPVSTSMTSVTSGGGSSTMNSYGGSISSSSSLAGYVLRHATPYMRGVTTTAGIQWQKPQMFAVRVVPFFAFQTASIFRMTLGSNTATLNILAQRGIGVSFGASAANTLSALVLDVHNGTTLTSVTSSFTPVLAQGFDVMVYSDGAGNVTLYVNDVQVATTSAGPSTAATANFNILQLGIENTTTLTTGSNVAFGSLKTFIS